MTTEGSQQEDGYSEIEIELDEETWEYLNSAAAKEGIDVNTFINRLLLKYLDRLHAEQTDG